VAQVGRSSLTPLVSAVLSERCARRVRSDACVARLRKDRRWSHWHQRVDAQSPADFRADVACAKAALEAAGGVAVSGYRAPTFSLGPRAPWAAAILAQTGHRYSSSIYPVRHDLYGQPDMPRLPFRHPGCGLWELPMTTLRLGPHNVPCSGGGWFRLLPYRLSRALLRRAGAALRAPGVFYTHPWEIDPAQPRMATPGRLARLRHYTGLHRTEARLRRLLRDFAWDRMDAAFADVLATDIIGGEVASRVPGALRG